MPRAVNGWKVCSACQERKPVSEFHRNGGRPDGLAYQCKVCKKAYNQSKRGKAVNQAAGKRYRQTEEGKATNRAASKRYRRTERGKAATVGTSTRHQALKMKATSDLTLESLVQLFAWHPACNYCGRAFGAEGSFKRTLEHIVPLSRGGSNTIDNLVCACVRCNSQKGDKLPEEWIDRWYEREEVTSAV